ncbi:uncharacterized protein LOC106642447 [Copidosoma floridanum]|uniref:uncharacterized protein LOC106642447 n=1 Tax=Copidosoma floridanum TaxID=29053 RepID=UPI0006C94D44|nr:uncharacterized protein LOC106642447 [Copidosoma floridanum]
MRRDVSRWAQRCEPCQRAKVQRHNRTALGNFDAPERHFDHIYVDLPVAVPIPDQQASTVARALYDNWIACFGTPFTITSDQGAQFESALFTELANMIGSNRIQTTPYHPQPNEMVERFHQTFKAGLMCCPDALWPEALPSVLLGLCNTFKEELQASPAEMLFDFTLRAIKPIQASRHVPSQKPFVFADLQRCSHVFQRIDAIRRPLDPPYTVPHKVVRCINKRTYTIEINGQPRTVSTDTLKPAHLEAADLPTTDFNVAAPAPPQPTGPTTTPTLVPTTTLAPTPAPLPKTTPTPTPMRRP